MPTIQLRFILLTLTGSALLSATVSAQTTQRVSVSSAGGQANADCVEASISADGYFVTFRSGATNLVPGDTNGVDDVFVHDLQSGLTTRVSVDSAGFEGNGFSQDPTISADGRFVVFRSNADNLVPGDTNVRDDFFVHDRQSGLTTRVNLSSQGAQANLGSTFYGNAAISADGRYVAFASLASNLVVLDTNAAEDCFVHDRQTGQTVAISVDALGRLGNSNSDFPSISADGRFVAFRSTASSLVAGDTNGSDDIFVRDLLLGQTTRVSVNSAGQQGSSWSNYTSISADGRFVGFYSAASNLVNGDTNGRLDAFVHDRRTGLTVRSSVDSGGVQGNHESRWGTVSAGGRFVTFFSDASNLVPGDTNNSSDIFVRDHQTGQTTRASVNSPGVQGDRFSDQSDLSADGRFIAFYSDATNLVSGDTNQVGDIFVHDRGPGSGATEETILLAVDVDAAVGQPITFTGYAAAPGSFARLLVSWNNAGSTFAGHSFGVGPGVLVVANGFCTQQGTGSFTTAPLPPSMLGRTFYAELGARDAAGVVYDSNTVERTVQ